MSKKLICNLNIIFKIYLYILNIFFDRYILNIYVHAYTILFKLYNFSMIYKKTSC